ncbi:MAG: hypothetical protein ACRD0N_05855, partial [Acidimicrobiales bacterium]
MRWPFRRQRTEAAPAGGAPVPPAPPPPPAPPSRRGRRHGPWDDLPRLEATAEHLETTAATSRFLSGLTTRRPHPLVLQPLAHDVSLAAPAGIVLGIATAVEQQAPDLELIPRSYPVEPHDVWVSEKRRAGAAARADGPPPPITIAVPPAGAARPEPAPLELAEPV